MRARTILTAMAINAALLLGSGSIPSALADAPSLVTDEATGGPEAQAFESRASLQGSAPADTEPTIRIERAQGERLAQAIGHYARARSLLIAAIREFDAGAKLASPQSLLDVTTFRHTLLDRAEDLERILDPQPRVNRGGVRFEADSRLLGEARK
jgi:hypothetical protein